MNLYFGLNCLESDYISVCKKKCWAFKKNIYFQISDPLKWNIALDSVVVVEFGSFHIEWRWNISTTYEGCHLPFFIQWCSLLWIYFRKLTARQNVPANIHVCSWEYGEGIGLSHANAKLCPFPISPEGSYTDDTSQEHHTPQLRTSPPKPGQPNPELHEFDDEFDDDDPLPVLGHCKALYSFDGEDRRHSVSSYLWNVRNEWRGAHCSHIKPTVNIPAELPVVEVVQSGPGCVFNDSVVLLTLRSERGHAGDGGGRGNARSVALTHRSSGKPSRSCQMNEHVTLYFPLQVLYIIEEDKGDGWTRARKQSGEEGYVPTSYVEITMERNSKGAVTYIWSYHCGLSSHPACRPHHPPCFLFLKITLQKEKIIGISTPAWTFICFSNFHPISLSSRVPL